jgi:membrane protein
MSRLFPYGDGMFAYFESTLGWRELLTRTAKETSADNGLGLAAQLAYYFFLALFPTFLALLALASFFPLHNLTDQVTTALGRFAPPEILSLIREQMTNISGGENGGVLSFGFIAALWSSSAALVAMIDALNRAYDIEEARPWWKVRLTAIGLTIALAIFALAAFTLVVAGPELAEGFASRFGLGPVFAWTWKIVQWPIAFALVAFAIGLVYYFAPDAEQEWVWVSPGALLATALWLVGSLAFRFYVMNFTSYQESYGAVGGVMVLLLWFYLSGLAIIVGAEMSAEIEHASPWAKDPGEKVPGEKKKIGLAASRAYRERSTQAHVAPPQPRPVVPVIAPAITAPPTWRERIAAALVWVVWPRARTRN